jgi:glycosyltransferase involved in cell wall biosynthesis
VTSWGVEPNKIAVVYNGVETRRPTLTKSEAKEKIGIKGNIILSIGRVVAGKGFRMLIKILPRLVEEVNPHIVLVILGDGYDLENLRKMAENLRVKNRVHFVGKKRPEEVWDYFFAADSFVLNSYSEGFPHVVLEAMAAGLPVVTTAVGGTPELIKNGRDGILLKYNDETGLIETIKIIYQNEELRQQLIENAQLTAGNFSVDKMIEMTTELLKKAINV